MTTSRRVGTDAGFAVAMALVGVVVMIASWRTGFGSLSEPDAGAFPFFSGLTVFAGAAAVAARAFVAPESGGADDIHVGAKLLGLIATMCGWIVLLPVTGFVLATFLVVPVLSKLLGLEGWAKPIGLGFAAAVMVYVLFQRLLFIDLPTGMFG